MAALLRGDDDDLRWLDADVTQDQRQDALADAAEPDDDEPARKFGVDGALHGARV